MDKELLNDRDFLDAVFLEEETISKHIYQEAKCAARTANNTDAYKSGYVAGVCKGQALGAFCSELILKSLLEPINISEKSLKTVESILELSFQSDKAAIEKGIEMSDSQMHKYRNRVVKSKKNDLSF